MSSDAPLDSLPTKSNNTQAFPYTPPPPEKGVPAVGERLGGYELLAVLGKGGMGVVYRARHLRLKKEFALKVLSPRWASDESAASRFERETEALGRLEHLHLVRASDAGVENEMPYLVMELLAGMNLEERTKQSGAWPIAEACEAVRQAALGLQHAYEHGLIHRDIKPSNLWLTAAGIVKVLDLGLVRLCGAERDATPMTAAGMWMGTPDYIAPEQILDSHSADTRADLYSLGCTLFHLLTGEPPFGPSTHPTLRQKSEAHLREAPPDIRTRRPDVPAELAGVVARLLAKRPEDRYQTPAEAAAALEPFARNAQLESLHSGDAPSTAAFSTRTGMSMATFPNVPAAASAPSHRAARRGLWGVGVVALLAGAGVLTFVLSRHNIPPFQTPPDVPAASSPKREAIIPAEVQPLQILSLEVKHFPTVNGHSAPPRLLGDKSFVTHLDDSVTVDARLSRPAYAFLIAFRPDGKADVIFPEKKNEPPLRTDRPRYPSVSAGFNYGLEEGTGLQVFALVVASEPLPSFEEWWSHCSGCPWKKNDTPPGVVWRADGVADVEAQTEDNPSGTRSGGKEIQGKTPVAQLDDWLRRTPGIETVQVLGFAVMPKEKR